LLDKSKENRKKKKREKRKQNAPKVRDNVAFLKKLFAPPEMVCKELQQIFL
jgi:hypothetical protein